MQYTKPEQEMRRIVKEVLRKELGHIGFTQKIVRDTPLDSFSLANRKYITKNGTTANRPTSSVVGQFYLDTSLVGGVGKPLWWNGTGWIDATGTYV